MEMAQVLSRVSPTFCPVKWRHASVNLAAGLIKTCCHHPFRRKSLNDGLAFNDHPDDRTVRAALAAGDRPAECQGCWEVEDLGHRSDRLYWSGHVWMTEALEQTPGPVPAAALPPTWLELNFSPLCQLKCSYCNPLVSSSWYQEVRQHGSYPTRQPHNDFSWFKNQGQDPYQEQDPEFRAVFDAWFKEIYPGIRLLTLTGGEPLLAKEFMPMLEWVRNNANRHLEISINSNCSLPAPLWDRFVDLAEEVTRPGRLKNLFLHPSLDTWGPGAEYIRHGLNLKLFDRNVRAYLRRTNGHLVVNCTLNNLSLHGLRDYWSWILDLKREFGSTRMLSSTAELLMSPRWQRLDLLPESHQIHLIELLEFMESHFREDGTGFTGAEIQSVRRALDFMRVPQDPERRRDDLADFHRFFQEHDRRRRTDLRATFPQMRDFFDLAEKASRRPEAEAL
ncbi:MAG: twitch domain-containing radical SAM protein [Bdellovibrionaceae bacterium]|nr:twitch domain-containing radical SAM protein [Pseudobdellovibrionaceae bacterium]